MKSYEAYRAERKIQMKIAVYGTGRLAEDFLEKLYKTKYNMEILYFVESAPVQVKYRNKRIISANEVDYAEIDKLIIATGWSNYEEIVSYLEKISGDWERDKEKIVYFRQLYSPEFYEAKKIMPYVSIKTTDNINFITSSKDHVIQNEMMYTKETFSKKLIDGFLTLAEKYYKDARTCTGGYFLDLGANIGTTSIYVKKLLGDEWKVVAVEACRDNYDLLRVNCILNHTEDIRTELFALSDQSGTASLQYEDGNPGGTCVVEGDGMTGEVSTVRLDDYVSQKVIAEKDIHYIWMDVEGFEPKVIKGGWKLFSSHRIAMIHEFTPSYYEKMGTMEWYYENIGKLYDSFIDMDLYIRKGQEKVYSISDIRQFTNQMKDRGIFQTDLFLF